jgi:hypothetical protein
VNMRRETDEQKMIVRCEVDEVSGRGKSALAFCGVPVRPPGDGDGAPKLRCGVRLKSTYKFKR